MQTFLEDVIRALNQITPNRIFYGGTHRTTYELVETAEKLLLQIKEGVHEFGSEDRCHCVDCGELLTEPDDLLIPFFSVCSNNHRHWYVMETAK